MPAHVDPETSCNLPRRNKAPAYPALVEPKSLPLAIGLNVLWPGAGYLYYGRKVLGILLMVILPFIIFAMPQLILLFWIIMIIDLIILQGKAKREIEFVSTKTCPHCAETIKVSAKVCRFCGRDL